MRDLKPCLSRSVNKSAGQLHNLLLSSFAKLEYSQKLKQPFWLKHQINNLLSFVDWQKLC